MKKKILLSILSILLVAAPCFGYAVRTNKTTLFTSESMVSATAEESAGVLIRHNTGFAVLLVTEDIAGGTGDVDIYAEYSDDNSSWTRAYISNMSGTITQEGNIATAFGNVTRRIIFTVRMANYIRIVFDPDANSTVTAAITFLEDK